MRLRNQEKEIELKPLGSPFCVLMTQHPVQRSLKERLSNISLKHVGCITGHYLILYVLCWDSNWMHLSLNPAHIWILRGKSGQIAENFK